MLKNPGRIAAHDGISRNIARNHAPTRHNGMSPDGDTRRDRHISTDPAFIFNHNGPHRYPLIPNGQLNILVGVIQTRKDDVLRHNDLGPDFDWTNHHGTNPDQRIIANLHGANPIVYHAEIVDDAMSSQRKRIEGQDIHPNAGPNNGRAILLMHKRIDKPAHPPTGPGLIVGN